MRLDERLEFDLRLYREKDVNGTFEAKHLSFALKEKLEGRLAFLFPMAMFKFLFPFGSVLSSTPSSPLAFPSPSKSSIGFRKGRNRTLTARR